MSAAPSLVLPPPPAFPGFVEAPTGLYRGVPEAVYHSRVAGIVNKSALDKVNRSPAHLRAWLDEEEDDEEPAEALALGKATHCRILEPDLFASTYVQAPVFADGRTKEGKAQRAAFAAEHVGKSPLSAEHWRAIEGMARSIEMHRTARLLLKHGESEVTVRWEDLDTGLVCKARADRVDLEAGVIVDVKTTEDARAEGFAKSVARFRYHVQHAHYCRGFAAAGVPIDHFIFIAVEKRPPYAVAVYELDADAIARGESDVDRNLATIAECLEHDRWPAYGDDIQQLSLPRWA